MELEKRLCPCGLNFKVLPTSTQEYHSADCRLKFTGERVMGAWVKPQDPNSLSAERKQLNRKSQALREEKRKPQNSEKNIKTTQNLDRKKSSLEKHGMLKILNTLDDLTVKPVSDIMQETKKSVMQEEKNGPLKIEKDTTPINVPAIIKTKRIDVKKNTSVGQDIYPITDSSSLQEIYGTGESVPENILLDSAKELHSAMKGLVANKPASEVRKLDAETARAMSDVGRTVAELLKVRHVIRTTK